MKIIKWTFNQNTGIVRTVTIEPGWSNMYPARALNKDGWIDLYGYECKYGEEVEFEGKRIKFLKEE